MRFPAFLVEQNEFRTINCLERWKTHFPVFTWKMLWNGIQTCFWGKRGKTHWSLKRVFRHSHGKMSRNGIHFYFEESDMKNLCFMRAFHIISHLRDCISKLKCIHSIDINGLLFHSKDIFLAFIFVYCIDSLKVFLLYLFMCSANLSFYFIWCLYLFSGVFHITYW